MQQYSIFFNHIPYSNQTLNEYKKRIRSEFIVHIQIHIKRI